MAASRRSLLEQNSPSQNEPGRELFEACRNGDLNKVKKLVSTHNVNAKDTAGRKSSPLHFAAGFGRKDVVEHLLECGANVHARDDGGLIPLHNACSFGHAEVVQLLLRHGADPNARDNWNYTPLHEAAIKGKIDVCIAMSEDLEGSFVELAGGNNEAEGLVEPLEGSFVELTGGKKKARGLVEPLEGSFVELTGGKKKAKGLVEPLEGSFVELTGGKKKAKGLVEPLEGSFVELTGGKKKAEGLVEPLEGSFVELTGGKKKAKGLVEPLEGSFVELTRGKKKAKICPGIHVTFECRICKRKYRSRDALLKHLKKHTKEFLCKKCTQAFPDAKALETHNLMKHSASFLCPYCGKTLRGKRSFLKHLSIHEGKRHKCPYQSCEKMFDSQKDLTDHINVHTGLKPYHCDACSAVFARAPSLRRHKLECDHSKKKLICSTCNKEYKSLSMLSDHRQSEHKRKPYVCKCGKMFKWRPSWSKHKKLCNSAA